MRGVGHLPVVHSSKRARRADGPPWVCCVSTASLAHSPSPTSSAGSQVPPRRNRLVPTRYCPARVGEHAGPLRLAVQDAALSRRKQGFDSPRGHQAASRPPGDVPERPVQRRSPLTIVVVLRVVTAAWSVCSSSVVVPECLSAGSTTCRPCRDHLHPAAQLGHQERSSRRVLRSGHTGPRAEHPGGPRSHRSESTRAGHGIPVPSSASCSETTGSA